MAQQTVAMTGALTASPNIWGTLDTEPQIPSAYAPGVVEEFVGPSRSSPPESASAIVANSFGGFLERFNPVSVISYPISVIGSAMGESVREVGKMIDIGKIIEIGRAAGLEKVLSPEQLAILGINSPEFYSVVNAVGTAVQPVDQVRSQATRVNKQFPSLWYVNFPKNMSSHDVNLVRQYRQNMLDFRSWSSQKWWEEVSRRCGAPDNISQRVQQSKEFAKIACEDMVKMSWLRTTKSPVDVNHHICCTSAELHESLISQVLGDWTTADRDVIDAIEPLLREIVRSAQVGVENSSALKVVILEKYVYNNDTKSVTSYIRLISFELREAFYSVIGGRKEPHSAVNLDLSLLQYEAIFESSLWNQYADSLQSNQKDPFQDFIKGQTIDM